MATTQRLSSRPASTRAARIRATGDMLVNDPEGWMSDGEHGPVWWIGSDSGGGRYPIGPNGPTMVPGHGPTDYPWTTQTAGALPAVIRATSLIVDPIADSPMRVQELGFGGRPLPTPRWLTDPMLVRPDARYTDDVAPATKKLTRSKFWRDLLQSALWWGLGGFIYQEQQTATSLEPLAGTLRLVDSKVLGTVRLDNGTLVWAINPGGGPDEVRFDRDGYLELGDVTYRLAVLRNPHSPIDSEGISQGVFAMSPSAFRMGYELEGYASGQFRSGVPNGVLQVQTPGLTQDLADELKASWMRAHGGGRRSIAVLNATTQFTPFNLSPVDAALADVKRLNVADVAFAFGLDPNVLGAGLQNSASYNNVRDYFRQHRDLSLGPWISALQDLLTSLLPGSQGVRLDLDAFTRDEPGVRYAAYATALDAGILTVDEVRAAEGLPPLPAAADTSADERNLSAAEVSQKVYLPYREGLLTRPEARQMVADAGASIDPDAPPDAEPPEPAADPEEPQTPTDDSTDEARAARSAARVTQLLGGGHG